MFSQLLCDAARVTLQRTITLAQPCSYIYQKPSGGVHEYLCNRLFELSDEAVERILSQLCELAVSGASPSASVQRTLVGLAGRSSRNALKVRPLPHFVFAVKRALFPTLMQPRPIRASAVPCHSRSVCGAQTVCSPSFDAPASGQNTHFAVCRSTGCCAPWRRTSTSLAPP